jgi:uroporphyrinogen decarboxylase
MDHRENFHRMMTAQGPVRMPLDMWITPPIGELIKRRTGQDDHVKAFDLDVRSLGFLAPSDEKVWRAAYEQIGFKMPASASIGFAGLMSIEPPKETLGSAYHLREAVHPLSVITEAKTLESLPWPDYRAAGLLDHIPAQVAAIRAEGRVVAMSAECTIFEFAWGLRGMDNLFMDLIEGNGIGDWLLDWFTDRSIITVDAYARAGADVIALGDDVGTQRGMMMSVPFWREHLKPRLKKVIDAIRAAETKHTWVRYHSDGDIRPIINDLVEIGVDILNPVQPECMPVPELIAEHRHHLAFWGMIGTQTTMPFGSPDDVRRVVRQLAEWARDGVRLVAFPTHMLEPDVPWENIEALVDEARKPLR